MYVVGGVFSVRWVLVLVPGNVVVLSKVDVLGVDDEDIGLRNDVWQGGL